MKTINEHIADMETDFMRLSKGYRRTLGRLARRQIESKPGTADHSNFWRGLSARQVSGLA